MARQDATRTQKGRGVQRLAWGAPLGSHMARCVCVCDSYAGLDTYGLLWQFGAQLLAERGMPHIHTVPLVLQDTATQRARHCTQEAAVVNNQDKEER